MSSKLIIVFSVEKPKFVKEPEDQYIHDYGEVEVRVRAHAIPKPTIHWLKDGKPIDLKAIDARSKELKYKVASSSSSDEHMASDFSITHFGHEDVGEVSA